MVPWQTSLTPDVGVDVPGLARPEGEPADERRRLVPAKVSAEGACRGTSSPAGLCVSATASRRARTGGLPHCGRGGKAGRNG